MEKNTFKTQMISQTWWQRNLIPAVGKQRLEDRTLKSVQFAQQAPYQPGLYDETVLKTVAAAAAAAATQKEVCIRDRDSFTFNCDKACDHFGDPEH